MKPSSLFRTSMVTLTLSTLASCGSCSQKTNEGVAPTPPTPAVLLTTGKAFETVSSNDLPFRFYQFLSANPNNVNYSPLSTEMAFSMVHLASSGSTQEALNKIFGFKKDGTYSFSSELTLQKELHAKKDEATPQLWIGNSVWSKAFKTVPTAYKDNLEKKVEGSLYALDLKKLNQWVDDATQHKIQNLIEKLEPTTHTLFINTLYFKARWVNGFQHQYTQPALFQSSPHQSEKVPMMMQSAPFAYYEDGSSQWIEMPYRGGPFAMILALPIKRYDLRAIEDHLSATCLNEVVSKLKIQKIDLRIPQFKFSKKMDLTQTFVDAGYSDLFQGGDFSRFIPKSEKGKNTQITQILQATTIEVNENGTEASAATSVMAGEAMSLELSKKFTADQPFIFLLRNTKSGEIYFIGRVYNPKQN